MSGALAVVLARGGSKGVPRKNVAPVAGRPCIAWTLEAAMSARRVGRVVVSTDDAEIADAARACGAEVIDRPPELASDAARVDDAARHAVLHIEETDSQRAIERAQRRFERIVILYGNVPVRPAGLIDRALEVMERTGCDSVQSYAPVGKYHPWWTARLDGDGRVKPWEGDVLNHGVHRRQELPEAFVPDGGVLVVSRAALMGGVPGVAQGPHAFFGLDRRGIVSGEGAVVDIDSPLDLVVADTILGRK